MLHNVKSVVFRYETSVVTIKMINDPIHKLDKSGMYRLNYSESTLSQTVIIVLVVKRSFKLCNYVQYIL